MARPVLYVLAGVNGAGKSSVSGHLLERDGLTWFNPDTFARELKASTGCDHETANAYAWQEGMRRLEEAIAKGLNHAFETTLGGKSVTAKILKAAKTHDVLIWFCGLSSPELHIARVKARVAAGGHPIPEEKIRERYPSAQLNLIKLMSHVAYIKHTSRSTTIARRQPPTAPCRTLCSCSIWKTAKSSPLPPMISRHCSVYRSGANPFLRPHYAPGRRATE